MYISGEIGKFLSNANLSVVLGCILLDDKMIGERFVVYTEQTLETPECTTRC